MASLPLGFLRVTKGAAEMTQPEQFSQGAKDIGAGALEAAQIPSAVIGPEGELAGQGALASKALSKAGEGVGAPASKAAELVPSASRAGRAFSAVMGAAKRSYKRQRPRRCSA